MYSRRKLLLVLAALGLLLGAFVGFWWPSTRSMSIDELGTSTSPESAGSNSPVITPTTQVPRVNTIEATQAAPELLPVAPFDANNSLRGTAVDGEVTKRI